MAKAATADALRRELEADIFADPLARAEPLPRSPIGFVYADGSVTLNRTDTPSLAERAAAHLAAALADAEFLKTQVGEAFWWRVEDPQRREAESAARLESAAAAFRDVAAACRVFDGDLTRCCMLGSAASPMPDRALVALHCVQLLNTAFPWRDHGGICVHGARGALDAALCRALEDMAHAALSLRGLRYFFKCVAAVNDLGRPESVAAAAVLQACPELLTAAAECDTVAPAAFLESALYHRLPAAALAVAADMRSAPRRFGNAWRRQEIATVATMCAVQCQDADPVGRRELLALCTMDHGDGFRCQPVRLTHVGFGNCRTGGMARWPLALVAAAHTCHATRKDPQAALRRLQAALDGEAGIVSAACAPPQTAQQVGREAVSEPETWPLQDVCWRLEHQTPLALYLIRRHPRGGELLQAAPQRLPMPMRANESPWQAALAAVRACQAGRRCSQLDRLPSGEQLWRLGEELGDREALAWLHDNPEGRSSPFRSEFSAATAANARAVLATAAWVLMCESAWARRAQPIVACALMGCSDEDPV